jgi:hypothetical protein
LQFPPPPTICKFLFARARFLQEALGKKKKKPKAQTIETSLYSNAKMKGAAAENPKKSL